MDKLISFVSGLSAVTDSFKHVAIGRVISYMLTCINLVGESLNVTPGFLNEWKNIRIPLNSKKKPPRNDQM